MQNIDSKQIIVVYCHERKTTISAHRLVAKPGETTGTEELRVQFNERGGEMSSKYCYIDYKSEINLSFGQDRRRLNARENTCDEFAQLAARMPATAAPSLSSDALNLPFWREREPPPEYIIFQILPKASMRVGENRREMWYVGWGVHCSCKTINHTRFMEHNKGPKPIR